MTVSEAAAVAQAEGWTLVPGNVVPGLYVEVHYDQSHKASEVGPVNLTFCNGRLMAYTRSLDFDTEYAMKLQEMIDKHGSQPRVKIDHLAWNGPGGGYSTDIRTTWVVDRERVEISFSPEERTGDGSLKHFRSASVSYVLLDSCSKQ